MSNEQEKKESRNVDRPSRLELKKTVETGQIRQSFSHGRSRTVTVEVKRKRSFAPSDGGTMRKLALEVTTPALAEEPQIAPVETATPLEKAETDAASRRPATLRSLTNEEKEARARAVHDARAEAVEAKKRAEADLKRRVSEVEQERRRAEEEETRAKSSEELRRQVEAEAARKLAEEEEARKRAKEGETKKAPAAAPQARRRPG